MEEIFTKVYETSFWGNDESNYYKGSSGLGSEISYNKEYIPFLKSFIKERSIKSIVDLGCGDFKCGPLIYDDLDIEYTGYDAYEKIINYHKENISGAKYNFIHADIFNDRDTLKGADLLILKDVLQHWKTEDIYIFLDFIKDKNIYSNIMIINCCNQTRDDQILDKTGNWRQLNHKYNPLKKYNPTRIFSYNSKEIILI